QQFGLRSAHPHRGISVPKNAETVCKTNANYLWDGTLAVSLQEMATSSGHGPAPDAHPIKDGSRHGLAEYLEDRTKPHARFHGTKRLRGQPRGVVVLD
ncbi:hypothetical protein, partial [Cupriavidus yeoncheonensis]|uniref:hypothetical protein n=1 Tax=Cupriavidus yeoncheonensis TaxID=1462994 RepID=UPI001BACBDBC